MTRPAGTNCITEAEDQLIDMLANCTQCRTFLGAANVAAAKVRMYAHAVSVPADVEEFTDIEWAALLPFVKVWTNDEEGFTFDVESSPNFYTTSGTLWWQAVAFVAVADVNDWEKYTRDLLNQMGTIMEELLDLTDDNLKIIKMVLSGPTQPRIENLQTDQWIACDVRVEWENG